MESMDSIQHRIGARFTLRHAAHISPVSERHSVTPSPVRTDSQFSTTSPFSSQSPREGWMKGRETASLERMKPFGRSVAWRCPACGHAFSYAESFRILNPFRFPCPSCKTALTTGRPGLAALVAVVVLTSLISLHVVGRYLSGEWTRLESLAALLVVFLVLAPIGFFVSGLFSFRRRL